MIDLPVVDGVQMTERVEKAAVGSGYEGYLRVDVRIGAFHYWSLVTQELADDELAFAFAMQKHRMDAIDEYRRSVNQGEGI